MAYIKEVKAKGIQDLSLRIKVKDSYFILYLSLACTKTEFVLECRDFQLIILPV